MELIIGLALLGIGVALVLNSIVTIPTVCFGIVTRFGKRIRDAQGQPRILSEGLNFVFPLVDEVRLFSREIPTEDLTINVLSKDRLKIEILGSLDWRIDQPDVFIEIKDIKTKITKKVGKELGGVAGVKEGDDFIKSRDELDRLINSILRLVRRPDYWVNKKDSGFEMGEIDLTGIEDERIKEKLKAENWKIPVKDGEFDTISFYKENATRIETLLNLEAGIKEQRANLEKLYGIDVLLFNLSEVRYTKETEEALEKQRQTKAEMEAAEEKRKKKLEIIKELRKMHIPAQMAINVAETITGDGERKIFSVEGLEGIASLFKGGKHE